MNQKSPLKEIVTELRGKKKKLSQAEIAEKLGVSASEFSDYVNAKRAMSDEKAMRLANIIEESPEKVLLATAICRCRHSRRNQRQNNEAQTLLERAENCFEKLISSAQSPHIRSDGFISLEEFPQISTGRWSVITGDRREIPPQGLGDVLALSASSCDLMFLPALKLPNDTLVQSDKITEIASDEALKQILQCNLLVVGSPAVSLMTREILRRCGATFQFNISSENYMKEKHLCDEISFEERHDEERLLEFSQNKETKDTIDHLLGTYRKPGFVDPIGFKAIRGRSIPRHRDYGIIALARNPWSEHHVTCLCAGVHGPGTAGALQMLSKGENFRGRPWGGVFNVGVPDKASWEKRFQFLNPKWETKEYNARKYIDSLKCMIDGKSKSQSEFDPVEISVEDLEKLHEFAQSLTAWPVNKSKLVD